MQFQEIYVRALDEPGIGYAASYKFQRAPFNCPKCGSRVYVRLRGRTRTTLGATCSACPWLTTFVMRPKLPPTDDQALLNL